MTFTEQDLKSLGFKRKWASDKSGYWYENKFNHKVLGGIIIAINSEMKLMNLGFKDSYNFHEMRWRVKLTPENLDLFIRFAKGEKL